MMIICVFGSQKNGSVCVCVCVWGGRRMVSVIMITTKISARQQNGENYNNECDILICLR